MHQMISTIMHSIDFKPVILSFIFGISLVRSHDRNLARLSYSTVLILVFVQAEKGDATS